MLDGGRLEIDATILECGCERCDRCSDCGGPARRERTLSCATPPLPEGDYELVVRGTELRSTLRIRDVTLPLPRICASAP